MKVPAAKMFCYQPLLSKAHKKFAVKTSVATMPLYFENAGNQKKLSGMRYQLPATRNPQPATRNQQPATRNPQPATSNQQPATSNPQPPTLCQPSSFSSYPNKNSTSSLLSFLINPASSVTSSLAICFLRCCSWSIFSSMVFLQIIL